MKITALSLLSFTAMAVQGHARRLGADPELEARFRAAPQAVKGPSISELAEFNKKIRASPEQRIGYFNNNQGGGGTQGTPAPRPFDPEIDDDEWPGAYPSTSTYSKQDLMVNIRWDSGPGENNVTAYNIFAQRPSYMISKSMKVEKPDPSDKTKQVGRVPLENFPIERWDQNNALYQLEITDELGDGMCCGEDGQGWITVTDKNRKVLWSTVSEFTYVMSAYFWKDSLGQFSLVTATHNVKREGGGGTDDGTLPPTTIKPTTKSPTRPPVQESYCRMCPTGSVGAPYRVIDMGGGDFINCMEMEQLYTTVGEEDCAEADEKGFTLFYQKLCECPGLEPDCPICDGDEVKFPQAPCPVCEDDNDIVCFDWELYFLFLEGSECKEIDQDIKDYIEQECGCL